MKVVEGGLVAGVLAIKNSERLASSWQSLTQQHRNLPITAFRLYFAALFMHSQQNGRLLRAC